MANGKRQADKGGKVLLLVCKGWLPFLFPFFFGFAFFAFAGTRVGGAAAAKEVMMKVE